MKIRLRPLIAITLACLFAALHVTCAPASTPTQPSVPAVPPAQPSPPVTTPVPAPPPKRAPQPPQETSTEPQQETPSKPLQPEKPPDIMNWLEADVTSVHTALLVLTMEKMHLKQKGDKWVHIFHTGIDGPNSSFEVEADNLLSAIEHIDKAYSLVETKKLPTETSATAANEREILLEVEMTLGLLKQQTSYTVQREKEAISWVEEYKNPYPRTSEYIDKKARIRSIHELFDSYRGKLVQPIDELTYIMSYGQPYLQGEEPKED